MSEDAIPISATLVLDTMPMVMHALRKEMRRRCPAELSVPQFRALMMLRRHRGASLSHVSSRLSSTVSSVSRLIDGLVERGFITRETAEDDRRRIILNLTPAGEAVLAEVRQAALVFLSERLAALPAADQDTLSRAMELLRGVFAGQRDERPEER